jgi:hypothetical protein
MDYEMFFADTLIEDDDLYRFNADVSKYLNKPFHHLVDGRTPWEVFADRKYMGNSRLAHCSDELKTKQVMAALEGKPHDLILGLYLDERDRLDRAAKKWSPRTVRSLLIEQKWTPRDVRALFSDIGIAEPRLYGLGFPHNNCGGMCVRAGQAQFASLLHHFPERYKAHERAQLKAMKAIGPTAGGFIRVTKNKTTEYLTMREFRLRVERGELSPNTYEFGGCGCFIDD